MCTSVLSTRDGREGSAVPKAQMAKGRLSDAGGLGFESQTGWATGKSSPRPWRDKHPAIKGLRPPEHHAGQLRLDRIEDLRVTDKRRMNVCTTVCVLVSSFGV